MMLLCDHCLPVTPAPACWCGSAEQCTRRWPGEMCSNCPALVLIGAEQGDFDGGRKDLQRLARASGCNGIAGWMHRARGVSVMLRSIALMPSCNGMAQMT